MEKELEVVLSIRRQAQLLQHNDDKMQTPSTKKELMERKGSQPGVKLVMEYTEDYINGNGDHFDTRHSQAELPSMNHLEETPEPNTFSNLMNS